MKLLTTIACALLLTVAAGDVRADGDRFQNVTVGLEMQKPAAWHYLTAEQNMENIKRAKLNDEELHRAMVKYSNSPLVAMVKHAEPFDDLNPSLKVQVKPFGQLKGSDPKEILKSISGQLKNAFADFTIAEAPTDVRVSRIKSAYMRINFTARAADDRTYPTASELWIVPHGDYFFLIGSGTRQDEKTGTRREIQQIVDTIRIRPPR